MDDDGHQLLMRLAGALWLTLFAVLVTFIVGVIIWAVAGPTVAILIFAAALVLFVWLPLKARGTTKSPPHH